MIIKLNIKNYRSIKEAEVSLGKITVLTGANNSGKSSLIYGLLTLKNIVKNPNRSIDNLLTIPLPFNPGGFKQTVFMKDEGLNIDLNISIQVGNIEVDYGLSFGNINSKFVLMIKKPFPFTVELDVAFPYPSNKTIRFPININENEGSFAWNGIFGNFIWEIGQKDINVKSIGRDEFRKICGSIDSALAIPTNELSKIDFVPDLRGFNSSYYNSTTSPGDTTEEQIAALLATNSLLSDLVAHYFKIITNEEFSIKFISGISSFSLEIMNNVTGLMVNLINEGAGIGQLVTMLAKALYNNDFITIDEPEIHMHPSMIDKLVSVLVEIAKKENKQFLISTHSEHFINSLLKNVVEKKISKDEVKVYYVHKEGKETKVEAQAINDDGQIEGGLKHFYEAELSNLKTFFKITD